jgi:hypothetical protein
LLDSEKEEERCQKSQKHLGYTIDGVVTNSERISMILTRNHLDDTWVSCFFSNQPVSSIVADIGKGKYVTILT